MTQIAKINVLVRVIFIRMHRWLSYARHVSFRRIDEIRHPFSSRNLSVPEKWDAKIMRQAFFFFLFFSPLSLLSFSPLVGPSLNPRKRICK